MNHSSRRDFLKHSMGLGAVALAGTGCTGLIGPNLAWQVVQEWLATPWGGERHSRRVEMITDIERSDAGSAP